MWKKLKSAFKELPEIFKEAGILSANRVTPIGSIVVMTALLIGILLFLMFGYSGNTPWPYLGEFVTLYLGVFTTSAVWLSGNKFTDSKYNTPMGSVGKPLTPSQQENINKVTEVVEKVVDKLSK